MSSPKYRDYPLLFSSNERLHSGTKNKKGWSGEGDKPIFSTLACTAKTEV